jgi:hypothetical protein
MVLNAMSANEFSTISAADSSLLTQDVILENLILYVASYFRMA